MIKHAEMTNLSSAASFYVFDYEFIIRGMKMNEYITSQKDYSLVFVI